jgi:hypothetical protein
MEPRIRIAFILLVLVQAGHSVEEYVFRLYDLFAPARYVAGLVGIEPSAGFAIVNSFIFLLGAWCWLAFVRPGRPAAWTMAWIWALIEIANGFAHIALASAADGYFPGLYTAPLLIASGLWLIACLARFDEQ